MEPPPPAPHRPARRGRVLPLGLGLFLLLVALPAPAGLSPAAWRMAAVALLMALWWISEALPLAATALLPLVLFPVLGILPSAATASAYANHLVFLFLGGFLLAAALERWGLHRRLALALVARVGTRPRRLVVGFLLASAALSAWVSNTATALMLLPIAMAVVEQAGRDEAGRRSLGICLMLAVAYGAGAGGVATLIGTPPNIVLAGQARELLPHVAEIGFGRWMLVGVPVSLVLLALAAAAILTLGPTAPLGGDGGRGRDHLRDELRSLGRLAPGERWVLGIFLVTVLLWLTRQDLPLGTRTLPGWARLFPEPAFLHDATVAVAAGLVLLAVRVRAKDGPTPLLDWRTARLRTPWGILLLFGGGFALAAGMQESGLAAWIGGRLTGLRGLPLPLVMLAVCLLTTFLTEVTSNTATSTLLLPILAAAAPALAVPPLLLMVPAALSASCAFMLPVATPPNAIVFGSGWLTVPRMARVGVVLNLAAALAVALLCWGLVPRALGPS